MLDLPDLPGANCRDADPELFFDENLYDVGRMYCLPCVEQEACLAWALARGERGLWGGTSGYERSVLQTRRVSTLPIPNRQTVQAR